MASDPVMSMPLQGVKINELIGAYVTVNNQIKQAELDYFIANGKNVVNDFIEIGLKGSILSHAI